jgi:predicted Holliday junction resolvase-like endonuclease
MTDHAITVLIAIVAIIVTVVINLLLFSYWAGKLEQQMKDNKESVDSTLERHEEAHNFHYKQERDHEASDNEHFKDNERHWAPQERVWLNQRFVEVGQRFDRLETLIRNNGIKT